MAREAEIIAEQRRGLGQRLATFRQAAGLTQAQLADALTYERSTLAHIEGGRGRADERFWQVADETCRAGGALLAAFHEFQAAKAEHEQRARERELTDVRSKAARLHRRSSDSAGFTAEVSPVQGNSFNVEQLRHDVHAVLAEGALSDASLDEWELTVARHGAATRDRPPALLLADLGADIAELKRTMDRCRSVSTLRRLTRVAAHLSGLICLTLVKLDDRAAFRGWARTARVAAIEVGDPKTHAWVLAQEAYGHFYSGDFREAVHVARHAQAVAPATACVGAVLAAALEARALAALGRSDETYMALRRAETSLAALDDNVVVASAFGYNEAQFRFHEGNALTHLGDTKAAWTAQERALELVPPSDFMDRAFTRLDRAVCLAQDGDAAEATRHALNTLLNLTEAQREGIITARARQLAESLPRQRQALQPVRELRDLLALPAKMEG